MSPLTHSSFSEFVRERQVALRDRIAIGSMNVDPPQLHALCRELNILNLSFLAFYPNGALVGTLAGLQEQKVLARLAELAAVSP